jgi:hypothetical protein
MLNKIQTVTLDADPDPIYETTDTLSAAMKKFRQKPICMYMAVHKDHHFMMFTSVEANDVIAFSEAVAFKPPCPPYCGKGGGGGNEALLVVV